MANDVGGCCDEVCETYDFVAEGSRGDFFGPAGDKGDAMPAFPVVAFAAAEVVGAVVIVFLFSRVHKAFGTVVTGNDKEGVVGGTSFFNSVHDLPHCPVAFDDEVAVFACLTFACECFVWRDGCVGTRYGIVEEKGLFVCCGLFDKGDRFFCEVWNDVFGCEARRSVSLASKEALGSTGCWLTDCAVVFEIDIRRHVQGCGDAVKIVESEIARSAGKWPGEVYGFAAVPSQSVIFEALNAFFARPV